MALIALALCGCRTPNPGSINAESPLHERALRHFSAAHLVKPSDTAATSALLPPWILLEEPGASHRIPGTVLEPALKVDSGPATLYFQASTTSFRGAAYPQATYLWATAAGKWQGIRMTLNGAGQAVLWEVLRDQSGQNLVFVAASIEQAARLEHGAPLEGRRYSVEQSRGIAGDVDVVRVIEDGPVPMGPMVYLDERSDVTSVICRCMPAQAGSLTGTSRYEVQAADSVLELWRQRNGKDLWPQAPLENWLRLPRVF